MDEQEPIFYFNTLHPFFLISHGARSFPLPGGLTPPLNAALSHHRQPFFLFWQPTPKPRPHSKNYSPQKSRLFSGSPILEGSLPNLAPATKGVKREISTTAFWTRHYAFATILQPIFHAMFCVAASPAFDPQIILIGPFSFNPEPR